MIANEKRILATKACCEEDGLYYSRYFFKQRIGSKMLLSGHHYVVQETLQKVIDGKIKRLIINVPPGYTKTTQAVIDFISRGLAINPKARFLHLSYSDSLALENSSTAKSIILSDEYQEMWPLEIRDDAKSKKKWWTKQGGGVYATSSAGQVTGFRAGYMEPGFTGTLLIDDPVKPDDAYSDVEREKINNRFNETIKSRLATEDVPIVVIMQRIHKNDLSGYLLKGGSGEMWHHLELPVIIDSSKEYNKDYTHGIPIEHGLEDGWLWPEKHSEEHRESLMSHKRTWFCQYLQDPDKYKVEGALWNQEWIDEHRVHRIPCDLKRIVVGVDPSGTDGKDDGDEIGIVIGGIGTDGIIYVTKDSSLKASPAKWGKKVVDDYTQLKADRIVGEKNYGGAMVQHTIRTVEGGRNVAYKDVSASRGKLVRAEPISSLYERGLMKHVGYFHKLEEELTTYDGTGKSPNRLDALVWLGTELMSKKEVRILTM